MNASRATSNEHAALLCSYRYHTRWIHRRARALRASLVVMAVVGAAIAGIVLAELSRAV